MYIWLAFMSLQAHKEERFLYPIYPLICIAATAVIDSFPDLFRDKYAVEDSPIVTYEHPIAERSLYLMGALHLWKYINTWTIPMMLEMLTDIELCTSFMELDLQRPYPTRGSDLSTWETIAAVPFLDTELSPAMFRSFFIPYKWTQKNTFGLYKLLKKHLHRYRRHRKHTAVILFSTEPKFTFSAHSSACPQFLLPVALLS